MTAIISLNKAVASSCTLETAGFLAFFQEFFSVGAKSIVMQIFLLFSDQISGGQKSEGGGQTAKLPQGRPPVEESQGSSHFHADFT